MLVSADLATFCILNSESTNCPRTAAVLGELAVQWQQMMGSLQRVEPATVSSQNLANAVENMNKTRIDATGNRLRLKGGERLYPENWSGSTSLGGFAHVDSKHEAGKLIQRITKGSAQGDRGVD